MTNKYEICGWAGHYFIIKEGKRVLDEKNRRFWFTTKNATEKTIVDIKKGIRKVS